MDEGIISPMASFLAWIPPPLPHLILSSFNSFVSSEPWTCLHQYEINLRMEDDINCV